MGGCLGERPGGGAGLALACQGYSAGSSGDPNLGVSSQTADLRRGGAAVVGGEW